MNSRKLVSALIVAAIAIALVIIVVWMFAYARRH